MSAAEAPAEVLLGLYDAYLRPIGSVDEIAKAVKTRPPPPPQPGGDRQSHRGGSRERQLLRSRSNLGSLSGLSVLSEALQSKGRCSSDGRNAASQRQGGPSRSRR